MVKPRNRILICVYLFFSQGNINPTLSLLMHTWIPTGKTQHTHTLYGATQTSLPSSELCLPALITYPQSAQPPRHEAEWQRARNAMLSLEGISEMLHYYPDQGQKREILERVSDYLLLSEVKWIINLHLCLFCSHFTPVWWNKLETMKNHQLLCLARAQQSLRKCSCFESI